MKKLGLATALLVAMTGAQAYQFEVQGQSEYVDASINGKNFTGGVEGTYYLKDVDSSKGPLAEAAFLNQASSVSAAYNYAELDVKNDSKVKNHSYGLKAEGYVPTKYVPVYASASYNHSVTKQNGYSDDNGDRYALEVGAVVAPNTLVAVGYTGTPDQFVFDTFNIMDNGIANSAMQSAGAIRSKTDAATARIKHVGQISGTNMAVGVEVAGLFADNNMYGMNADLYLNPKLSVGATFVGTDGRARFAGLNDGYNVGRFDQAYGANVNYFVTPAIAVGVSYLHANQKDAPAVNGKAVKLDTDTVGVNAKFRF
ncbi:porin Omp33-36 [Acinetobacter rudis]|uniref:Porin Omp33-36 n=1 Tax=Acinetobacter rudis TaxID=632955 RepID=A0AAW8JBC6_9GAMM|nr:porin Omp33-36 [Acinetobacter rudis]MDQ8936883.1 porin Omp33-36 [Acinetobacter rudis]MDQ9019095.1 porin Omp33-36 [Acinetobacter rudis]